MTPLTDADLVAVRAEVLPPRQPENHIPWSQIAPLVKPGMTGGQVATAILRALGLPPDGRRYAVLTMRRAGGTPLAVVLKDGVEIVSAEESDRRHAVGRVVWCPSDEALA
jgi:hypothetical protein